MENTNKLTGKDLINVGIYSAMTLVILNITGTFTPLVRIEETIVPD